jgi:hypothetical protein
LQAWEELTQGATAKAAASATESKAAAQPQVTQDEARKEAAEPTKQGAGENDLEDSKSQTNNDAAKDQAGHEGTESSAPADFGALISNEVKDLKDAKKRPFVAHDTGIKTCMFVLMPLVSENTPGPCEVRKQLICDNIKLVHSRKCGHSWAPMAQ